MQLDVCNLVSDDSIHIKAWPAQLKKKKFIIL